MRSFPEPSSYWSEDEGRRAVEAWRRSGETASAFARQHGIRAKRLVWWSKRLALSARSSTALVSLVPATVVSAVDEVAAVIHVADVAIELASAMPMQIAAIASALARRTL